MSVEQTDVVDIISIDRETGHVVLTISDHLDWSDSVGHQAILQKKLNTYLAFIESGEILGQCPKAKNRRKRQSISIYARASFGAEVESWWHREGSIAGTGAGRKRIG
jgi:hypothetical protein